MTKQNEARLVFRMQGIVDRLRQGILECRAGLVEGHSVHRKIPAGLLWVPFKHQGHRMSTVLRPPGRTVRWPSGRGLCLANVRDDAHKRARKAALSIGRLGAWKRNFDI